ncbi:MAG: ATP synthase subunit I [Gammaproteobacteria bacterium]
MRTGILLGDEASFVPDVNPLASVSRVLLAQLSMGALIAGIALLIGGSTAAWSAVLGNLICVIPNAFLALRIVIGGAVAPGQDPRRMLRASYVGVAGKFLLTAALFAAVFVLVRPLAAGWLFAAFVLTQLVVGVFLLVGRETGFSKRVDG